jgi:hypothetical protein
MPSSGRILGVFRYALMTSAPLLVGVRHNLEKSEAQRMLRRAIETKGACTQDCRGKIGCNAAEH